MRVIAVPNVSEGRDASLIARLAETVRAAGAAVADVHSDEAHHRSVITAASEPGRLVEAMVALAEACREIDLTLHRGVHPRLGALDVCPFVVGPATVEEAVAAARSAGEAIWEQARIPVYLYGYAATRPACASLPDLRKGGLHGLIERSRGPLPPDFGNAPIDPRHGVVCVGARDVLVAFNVWLRCDGDAARAIAASVRRAGLPGVRTLGLDLGDGLSQVSMNLTRPWEAGVDRAFDAVASLAAAAGVEVHATELVGVPPERYMPDPDAQAARLLIGPGRSLERALAGG